MHTFFLIVAIVTAAYSHYWPPYGGVNGGSHVANGDLAADWQGKGIACPPDWPLGTQVMLEDEPGIVWMCVDRGPLVTYTRNGYPILDFMERDARYAHKTPVTVYVVETVETPHIPQ
jgi:hypothetical protein